VISCSTAGRSCRGCAWRGCSSMVRRRNERLSVSFCFILLCTSRLAASVTLKAATNTNSATGTAAGTQNTGGSGGLIAVNQDAPDTFLIASFPQMKQILFTKLPDVAWRPLIIDGLVSPQAVAIDEGNGKLYVSDVPASTVYWYQLTLGADGGLTVGQRNIAVQMVWARGMTTDMGGNLYIAGRRLANLPALPVEAVLKADAVAIAQTDPAVLEAQAEAQTGNVVTTPPPPNTKNLVPQTPAGATPGQKAPAAGPPGGVPVVDVWTRDNTGTGQPDSKPRLWTASAVAVDPMHVFWTNSAAGKQSGSVVRGAQAPSANAIEVISENVDSVMSLALTPQSIFFGGGGYVYGVSKSASLSCVETSAAGSTGAEAEKCGRIAAVKSPTAIVWDGDATLYVADSLAGEIYTLPSGSTAATPAEKFMSAPGIYSMSVYRAAPQASAELDMQGAATSLVDRIWRMFG